MKVIILAGGQGTRISEETEIRPKPMVEIGGKPILWHIMKIYSFYGFNEFVILLGYKGQSIKKYFANYFLLESDVTIDLSKNKLEIHNNFSEPWKVTLIDTGLDTMTGGRILRAQPYIKNETFMLTYGDGVADINLNSLVQFHKSHGKLVTMTTIQPEGRYGTVDSGSDGRIKEFSEKPKGDGYWVNGGFFVCQPGVFDYIREGDATAFETSSLRELAKSDQLYAYMHHGFWKCMDTLRDKIALNQMWNNNHAPWKIWH